MEYFSASEHAGNRLLKYARNLVRIVVDGVSIPEVAKHTIHEISQDPVLCDGVKILTVQGTISCYHEVDRLQAQQ
jgi:hypothetical protein